MGGSYGSTKSVSGTRSESDAASLAVTSVTKSEANNQVVSSSSMPAGFVPRSVAELHPEYSHAEPYHFTAKTDSARLVLEQASGATALLRAPLAPTQPATKTDSNEKVQLLEERWNPKTNHTREAIPLKQSLDTVNADDFSDLAANISESEEVLSQTTGRNSNGSPTSFSRTTKKSSRKNFLRINGKNPTVKPASESSKRNTTERQASKLVSDENNVAQINVLSSNQSGRTSGSNKEPSDAAYLHEGRSSVQRRSKVPGLPIGILRPRALRSVANTSNSPPKMPVVADSFVLPPPDESLQSLSSSEEHAQGNYDDAYETRSSDISSASSAERDKYFAATEPSPLVSPVKPPLPSSSKKPSTTSITRPSALSSRKSSKGSYPARKTVSFREEKPTIIEPNLKSPAEKAAASAAELSDSLEDPRYGLTGASAEDLSARRQPRSSMSFDERMAAQKGTEAATPQNDQPQSLSADDLRAMKKRQSMAVRDAISQQIRGIPRSAMLALAESEMSEEQQNIDRESHVEPLTDDWFNDMSPTSSRIRKMSEAEPTNRDSYMSRSRARSTKSIRLPPEIRPGQAPPPPPPPPFEPTRNTVKSIRMIPEPPPARESFAKLRAVGASEALSFELPPPTAT